MNFAHRPGASAICLAARRSCLPLLALALSALTGCAAQPSLGLSAQRELFPAVLDNDRPILIRRWDAAKYTCAGNITMTCDGATSSHFMCRCPSIPLPRL